MAKVLHVSGFIDRDDGFSLSPELMERIIRKVIALLGRLGCTIHADWRLGERPELEDRLG